jgi:hypothetical protein
MATTTPSAAFTEAAITIPGYDQHKSSKLFHVCFPSYLSDGRDRKGSARLIA